MKYLAWMLILFVALTAYAQDNSVEIEKASKTNMFQKAAKLYSQGKYQAAVDELDTVAKELENNPSTSKTQFGFIAYWQGLALNRLQDYSNSIAKFDKALGMDYSPQDLNYEYGQALFAMERNSEARMQFKESLKKKFKRGVCLYYIGFLSKEMGEKKKAVTFYKAIQKLGPEEAKEVMQAAEMQIGDIYLDQVENHPDAFRAVETYVIPQYEKAMAVDPKSKLAPEIKDKITALQRKYDLVVFQMRNGRPTLIPPYFLRFSLEVAQDTNVTFSPTETTVSKSKQQSIFTRNDVMGRYTFYYKNILSISPEFRINYARYYHRIPEIYRNDNYLLAPTIRTAHEHTLWNKPASFLADFEYGESKRDVNSEQKLVFSFRSQMVMIGERFNLFKGGESTLRLRHRTFDSYVNGNDSKTTSLVYEQTKNITSSLLIFYLSYDIMRATNSIYNTNAFTARTDIIFEKYRDWFTPSAGLMLTSTNPVNNYQTRGRELLIYPNARLTRSFGNNWRANLKYDFQKNISKDETSFAYQRSVYGFELEYIF